MTVEELQHLPKYILLHHRQHIGTVWDKLPKNMQIDPDIWKYQYCTIHYNTQSDQIDGPPPTILRCALCNK